MALVTKTSSKRSKASFVKSKGGTGVRVSPGKGGVRVGITHCSSKRSASNLKTTY